MQDAGEIVTRLRLDQHVNVIRHDDEAIEQITFVVEMAERLGDKARRCGIA